MAETIQMMDKEPILQVDLVTQEKIAILIQEEAIVLQVILRSLLLEEITHKAKTATIPETIATHLQDHTVALLLPMEMVIAEDLMVEEAEAVAEVLLDLQEEVDDKQLTQLLLLKIQL